VAGRKKGLCGGLEGVSRSGETKGETHNMHQESKGAETTTKTMERKHGTKVIANEWGDGDARTF